MSAAVLEIEDVGVRFGGVPALDGLSLRHDAGGIVGLIGANGAGKTTLVNVLSGVVRPDRGHVRLDGRELIGRPAHRIARAGLARTFQNLRLFDSLSVLENVLTPYRSVHRGRDRAGRDHALGLLDEVGLSGLGDQRPGALAYGQQRRLELARALSLDPRILLLDEPLAGLPASESEELLTLFDRLRRRDVTVVLVDHDVPSVFRISDRVVVLEQGRLLADGSPAQVAADPAVRTSYLGEAG